MLRISRLALSRGTRRLLVDAELTVHAGQKVGVVGANGCGKSSLFAAIRGELLPDAGEIDLPARWTLAHVAQETPSTPMPAIEYVLDGDRELREVERALAAAEAPDAGDRGHDLALLHQRFDAIGGYGACPRGDAARGPRLSRRAAVAARRSLLGRLAHAPQPRAGAHVPL